MLYYDGEKGGISLQSETKRLDAVAEILAGVGGFDPSGTYEYELVQPNSFSDTGELAALEVQRRSEPVSAKQMLSAGDVLVKRRKPSFVHVVGDGGAQMVASQNLLVVRPGPEVDPLYLGCLLEQKEIIGQIEHVTGTSSVIKAISLKKLGEITIPVIPMAEQRSLGRFWQISRKRKRLLREYIEEGDNLLSAAVSKTINGGGNKR